MGGRELSGEGNELLSACLASWLGHHAILEKAERGRYSTLVREEGERDVGIVYNMVFFSIKGTWQRGRFSGVFAEMGSA